MRITIQDNMNYLAELEAKYPQYKSVIDKTAKMITFAGVQPELEALIFDGEPCMMLWWNYKEEAYLAYYIYDNKLYDTVHVEACSEDGELEHFKLSWNNAIDYYNEYWHDDLFVFNIYLYGEV